MLRVVTDLKQLLLIGEKEISPAAEIIGGLYFHFEELAEKLGVTFDAGKPGLSWTDRSAPIRTNSERWEAEVSAGAMNEGMYWDAAACV